MCIWLQYHVEHHGICIEHSFKSSNIFEGLGGYILGSRRGAVVKDVEHISGNCVGQHLSGAGSSPAGSVGRDLNLQKLNFQYLTTSVAVVLVVR